VRGVVNIYKSHFTNEYPHFTQMNEFVYTTVP
jgi:hypothetical protein